MFKSIGGLEGFKKLTNASQATEMFEREFERAGQPMMANRINYAETFLSQFSTIEKQIQAQSTTTAGAGRKTGSFTWPTPNNTGISSEYNEYRVWDQYNGGYHKGIDIPAVEGSPIVASNGGVVLESYYHNSYGNTVLIDHGGSLTTRYAHMSTRLVSQGESVAKGQKIGTVGNTGDSYGAHLHFEVRENGAFISPWSITNQNM